MSSIALAGAPMAPDREALDRIRDRLVRRMPTDRVLGWAIPLLITVIAGYFRFSKITRPGSKVFDEVYYAQDSWSLLHHGVEVDIHNAATAPGCTSGHCGFIVHPPLGKWMIAFGEMIYGNNPLGWRFSSAVVGTLAILLIARIARRMFRSTLLGCIAGLLLAMDGLEFVQSRVSMLDIFLMFWVLAAFGCLVLDRDYGRNRMAKLLEHPLGTRDLGPWLGLRPWRWACGFCLGAGVATKWDGVFWVPVFFVLAVWWDAGARRTAGAGHPIQGALLKDGLPALLPFFVLIPAIYVASWTGWFISDGAHAWDHDRYVHAGQSWFAHDRAVLGGWWRYQWEIWNFHNTLHSSHPYLSKPLGWLLLSRPVAYFYASPKGCGAASCSQEVLGVGTPAVFWASILALVAMLWRMFGRFDWRAAAIVLSFLAGWLTWIYDESKLVPNCGEAATNCHRTMFLFYILPDVPFMVLAVTMAVGMIIGLRRVTDLRRGIGATVAGIYLVSVIVNFAWLYPVLAGQVITYDEWHARMKPMDWTCNNQPKHRNEHKELAGCWI